MIPKRATVTLGLLCASMAGACGETVLSSGHSEIHFRYSSGTGFILDVWDHDNRIFLDPATTLMQVNPVGRVIAPGGLAWERLGVQGEATVWVIPQDNPAVASPPRDVIWFGTRSVIASGTFTTLESFPSPTGNQIGLKLLSVTGSGPDAGGEFSLFTTDNFGDPTFRFATVDGIDPNDFNTDVIKPINTQSHTHYNWAFTQPGEYHITVRAYGRLFPSRQTVTRDQTYVFEVLLPEVPPISAVLDGEMTALSWDASGNETYIIEATTTLAAEGWSEVQRVTPPAGPYTFEIERNGGRAFFRVRVE